MGDFTKYTEIENVDRDIFLAKLKKFELTHPKMRYVVQPKCDGANFQFDVNRNDEFNCGCRSHYLGEDGSFNNYQAVIEKFNLKEKAFAVKKYLIKKWAEGAFEDPDTFEILSDKFDLILYGELAGGVYRHKDVEKTEKGACMIQGRISYAPFNFWVCFDILVKNDSKAVYLNPMDVQIICEDLDIPVIENRFEGTLDECLNYDINFVDDIGNKLFGLPLVEKDNITEGVVIKPMQFSRFDDGSRVIGKHKTTKFREQRQRVKVEFVLPEKEKEWLNKLNEFVTESRYYSVISKLDDKEKQDFGKILHGFIDDVWKDFRKDNDMTVMEEEVDLKIIGKTLAKMVSDFIRPYYMKQF